MIGGIKSGDITLKKALNFATYSVLIHTINLTAIFQSYRD